MFDIRNNTFAISLFGWFIQFNWINLTVNIGRETKVSEEYQYDLLSPSVISKLKGEEQVKEAAQ